MVIGICWTQVIEITNIDKGFKNQYFKIGSFRKVQCIKSFKIKTAIEIIKSIDEEN